MGPMDEFQRRCRQMMWEDLGMPEAIRVMETPNAKPSGSQPMVRDVCDRSAVPEERLLCAAAGGNRREQPCRCLRMNRRPEKFADEPQNTHDGVLTEIGCEQGGSATLNHTPTDEGTPDPQKVVEHAGT
ncbi:hypothetical protein GDO81_006339 [Engystomops pustulosus]|uniref:Uncharacterized protein n=1 Tax=Engystomops pustulosus TaxID=76066 RepID=A0AAV7CZ34_ENGPU|nr:hypothetical protein GDO81_006339 [Engystomops pustulosus]